MHVQVARIGKPHGIRGEVTVQLFTDEPEVRLAVGEKLQVEPSTPLASDGLLTVAGLKWNKTILVLRFAEVSTRNDAELLRNHVLTIDTEDAEETEGYYEHELVGLDVYVVPDLETEELTDKVGTVSGLQAMPTQDLLTVELDGGEEALVPFVDEIVPEVNLEEGFVVMCPPPGLLTLNSEADESQDPADDEGRA